MRRRRLENRKTRMMTKRASLKSHQTRKRKRMEVKRALGSECATFTLAQREILSLKHG